MKEPDRIPLDPTTPRPQDVNKIPMPSLAQEAQTYPEPMSNDVVPREGAETAFLKFIADQEQSRKQYQERLKKIRQEDKDST